MSFLRTDEPWFTQKILLSPPIRGTGGRGTPSGINHIMATRVVISIAKVRARIHCPRCPSSRKAPLARFHAFAGFSSLVAIVKSRIGFLCFTCNDMLGILRECATSDFVERGTTAFEDAETEGERAPPISRTLGQPSATSSNVRTGQPLA